MKTLRPLLFLVSLLLIVGLACSGGATPTQPPTEKPTQVQEPTATPEPTEVPPTATEALPTEPPTPEPLADFFTEEFDVDPGEMWMMNVIGPGAEDHAGSVKTEFSDSNFRVELPEKDLYLYYTYIGNSYEDVRIDLRADNQGVNTNNVSLFCRMGEDGWYEWSVRSDGLWDLWAVTDKYNRVFNGGTNAIKQGKAINEYAMSCKGDKIALFVNGEEVKGSPFTEGSYGLRDGAVGFNISSLWVTPVIVEVDWFKISEP